MRGKIEELPEQGSSRFVPLMAHNLARNPYCGWIFGDPSKLISSYRPNPDEMTLRRGDEIPQSSRPATSGMHNAKNERTMQFAYNRSLRFGRLIILSSQ